MPVRRCPIVSAASCVLIALVSLTWIQGGCESEHSAPASSNSPPPGPAVVAPAVGSQPASSAAAGPRNSPPPGTAELAAERAEMVERQLRNPIDGRKPITDEKILEIMNLVPRHEFVPKDVRRMAYTDRPVPIGFDQTISQPYIVALMTEALALPPNAKVLEVGTGSGYQAAILAHLASQVFTVEILHPLYQQAERALREQGYTNVLCRRGDGYNGWPDEAPFDGIIVTFAPDKLPQPLWDQLKPGGRLVVPIGEAGQPQHLEVRTKKSDGSALTEVIAGVQFVPMTREK